ncbi:MAG: cysteine desulfurase [Deltaproteobacteria bacterium]|nr:cysteine desulfurase [Deltaproteobacteria bacterium]
MKPEISNHRRDFPMLTRKMHGQPLIYLDNGATTQKPLTVLNRMDQFYREEYATVRRGVYGLSQKATEACIASRETCRRFLNARSADEIVFTKGTTEAINLVAASYGRKFVQAGDEIIISEIEHHANIVPWQRLAEEKGAQLRIVPVNDQGELIFSAFEKLLSPKTRIVAIAHISNALGTIHPIREIIAMAHKAGAVVLIDGAQAAAHMNVDVRELDADFYCFSGHKTFGPTGIGVLYGKLALLTAMDPYQCGGDMIDEVRFEKTTFAPPPAKFEAGTPPIAQIIGLGEALRYIEAIGREQIAAYEHELLLYATEALRRIPGLKIIGEAHHKAAIISFIMDGVHPHDIGTILDSQGIAIRAGHHCAQPTMRRFGVPATARASFAFYNTREDIDELIKAVSSVRKVFGP